METFLALFDLFRYMAGLLAACVIFSLSMPRWKRFQLRAILGSVVCILISFNYMFITKLPTEGIGFAVFGILGFFWWWGLSLLGAVYLKFCFKMGWCNAIYRSMLGSILQHIVTVIIRYWIVRTLYHHFPEERTVLYVLTTLLIYVIVYVAVYFMIRRITSTEKVTVEESRRNFLFYLLFTVFISIISSTVGGIMDWVASDLEKYEELRTDYLLIEYFCIGVSLLYCFSILFFQYNFYAMQKLRRKNEFMERQMEERRRQYELSKQNIDLINKRCHDLKHQISALAYASDAERKSLIEETQKAVMIYDSGIKTDNDALNTLLTEKYLYGVSHGIRLSCNIKTFGLDKIDVIDLYTILGNALDNAIENVEKLSDPDKKTVNLSIDNSGGVLCMQIVNYYEGEIVMKNGFPVTKKADAENHGIGLKSIASIMQRYNGFIQINSDDGVFDLRMIVPLN